LNGYPNFFTDLESHITNILQESPQKTQIALTKEFQSLRSTYIPVGDPNPADTINANVLARRFLVSAVLDHMGQTELRIWANKQTIFDLT
jgi:hypothetical protein